MTYSYHDKMNSRNEASVAFLSATTNAIFSQKGAFVRPLTLSRPTFRAPSVSPLRSAIIHMKLPDTKLPQTSAKSAEQTSNNFEKVKYNRYALGALYIALILYGFLFAPGSFSDLGQIGMIFNPSAQEQVNDLFFALFNLLGVIATNYAVLFNPGAPRQTRLSTRLFSAAGLFLGFGALGPYLIGREYVPQISKEEVAEHGVLSRILENPIFLIGNALFALWCYAFAFGMFTPGSEELHNVMFFASQQELARLVTTDRGVCLSVIDSIVLSTVIWGPLTEDMTRRGWFKQNEAVESISTALLIMLAPGLGVALYFLIRPSLPSRAGQKNVSVDP